MHFRTMRSAALLPRLPLPLLEHSGAGAQRSHGIGRGRSKTENNVEFSPQPTVQDVALDGHLDTGPIEVRWHNDVASWRDTERDEWELAHRLLRFIDT